MERELKTYKKKTFQVTLFGKYVPICTIPEKRILFLLYKVAILILHRSSHKYSNGQGEKGKGSGGRGGGC